MENTISIPSKNGKLTGFKAFKEAVQSGLDLRKPFRVHRQRSEGKEFYIFNQMLQRA